MKIKSISGEKGVVKEINGNRVKVLLPFSKGCEKCGLCKRISDSSMEVEVYAKGDIHKGEKVKIYINPKAVIVSSLMVYIFPLLFMVAGYFIGRVVGNLLNVKGELLPAAFSFLFLFSSFIPVHIFDRIKSRDNKFKIYAVPED